MRSAFLLVKSQVINHRYSIIFSAVCLVHCAQLLFFLITFEVCQELFSLFFSSSTSRLLVL